MVKELCMQLVNDLRNSYQAEEEKNEWVKQNDVSGKLNPADFGN